MDDEDIDVTVHKLFLTPDEGSQPSSQNILAEATRFVLSTTRETHWRAPPCVDPAQFGTHSISYVICFSLPSIRDLLYKT